MINFSKLVLHEICLKVYQTGKKTRALDALYQHDIVLIRENFFFHFFFRDQIELDKFVSEFVWLKKSVTFVC